MITLKVALSKDSATGQIKSTNLFYSSYLFSSSELWIKDKYPKKSTNILFSHSRCIQRTCNDKIIATKYQRLQIYSPTLTTQVLLL